MRNQQRTLVKKACAWSFTVALLAVMVPGSTVYAVTTSADSWQAVDVSSGIELTQPSAGTVQVKFPGEQFPSYETATLRPVSSDSSKSFTGNYSAAKVDSVQFTLTSDIAALGVGSCVLLKSNGREWKALNIKPAAVVGQPEVNRVSMDLVAGGWRTAASGDPSAMWASDIKSVDSLELKLVRKSAVVAAQTFGVSAFSLESDRSVGSLSPLEAALFARFGVTSAAEVTDATAEAQSDLQQILAAYEPGYFEKSLFKAELSESDGTGITITWKGLAGHTYTVMRYDSMSDETGDALNEPMMATSSNPDRPVVDMSYKDVDAVGGTQYFYRVIQD